MTQDPPDLSTLEELSCESPMAHAEHLFVVHQPGDAEDENFRCPGRNEDE